MNIFNQVLSYLGPALTLVTLIIACTWQPRRGKALICIYLFLLFVNHVLWRVLITLTNRDLVEWFSLTARSLNTSQVISYHLASVMFLVYVVMSRRFAMLARSDTRPGECDTPAAERVMGPPASEPETTERSIKEDAVAPMPQTELQPGPSRSCSIPGVIAGTLVIGVGVLNLWVQSHTKLAMRVYVVGAWLFAGAVIIVRSLLGPFGLLKMLMLFFGAFFVWLIVPWLPGSLRTAQATGSAEAYGALFGVLLVVGLGVVLLVFGFKRRKEASPRP